jgi:hypothetical protein
LIGFPYNGIVVSKDFSSSNEQTNNSDQTLISLMDQLRTATDPETIRRLSQEIERVIFRKQLENA